MKNKIIMVSNKSMYDIEAVDEIKKFLYFLADPRNKNEIYEAQEKKNIRRTLETNLDIG